MTPSLRLTISFLAFGIFAFAGTAAFAEGAATFPLPPLDRFGEVLSRPLFSSDRRSHESAVAATPAGAVSLTGIVIDGMQRYAFVKEGTEPRAKRVEEGQRIQAGTVRRILPDRVLVVLPNGAQSAVLLFDPAKLKKTAAAPLAAGPAASAPASPAPSAEPQHPPKPAVSPAPIRRP